MTLADFRGIKRSAEDETQAATGDAPAPHEKGHPGPAEYSKIGLILGVITAVEVALFYMDMAQWALVAILILLSATKFGFVVLWFMHLKFDSQLFSAPLVIGMAFAVALFAVLLASLGGGLV